MCARRPARMARINLHVVTWNHSLQPMFADQRSNALIGLHQVPGIALRVARRPHAFEVGIPINAVARDHMRSYGRLHLDPLRSERMAFGSKAAMDAGTDLR